MAELPKDFAFREEAFLMIKIACELAEEYDITITEAGNIIFASGQDTPDGIRAYAKLYYSAKKKEEITRCPDPNHFWRQQEMLRAINHVPPPSITNYTSSTGSAPASILEKAKGLIK